MGPVAFEGVSRAVCSVTPWCHAQHGSWVSSYCKPPHEMPKFSCFWPPPQAHRSRNTRTCTFQPVPDPSHGDLVRVWRKQSKMSQEAMEEVMTLPGERVHPGCCWLWLSSPHLPVPGLTASTHVFLIALKVLATEPVFRDAGNLHHHQVRKNHKWVKNPNQT